jgi:RND family efflux transporter MFP subunit
VVTAGQSVIRIARGSERDVVVAVPETSLRAVQSAKNLIMTSPTLAGERLVGRIRESSPVADSASRTYSIKIEPVPAKSADRLPLGASATVSFELPASPGVLVPLSALHSRTSDPKVWVVDEATLTVRSVSVQIAEGGLRDSGVMVQISDAGGLRLGQLVVTAGANLLREGQKIRLPTASTSSTGPTSSTGLSSTASPRP